MLMKLFRLMIKRCAGKFIYLSEKRTQNYSKGISHEKKNSIKLIWGAKL